jgi:hypothetical protein
MASESSDPEMPDISLDDSYDIAPSKRNETRIGLLCSYSSFVAVSISLSCWPFEISACFSVYCLFLLIVTFISAFLVAYETNALYAAMDGDGARLAVALATLFTSSPLVAFFFSISEHLL